MEDLRITGYNALLTPAFLQEEFPAVSCSIYKKRRERALENRKLTSFFLTHTV